jgi:hypothetical protein
VRYFFPPSISAALQNPIGLVLFFAALCWSPHLASAQKTIAPRDTAIARVFDKNADLKWIRLFKGRLDDVTLVDLHLGFDGRSCRGYLLYPKSKTRLRLEGVFLDSTRFKLEEYDAARQISGKLEGRLSGRHIEADWTNHNASFGSRLEADEPLAGQTLSVNCGDNKWVIRYITRFNGARADMVLSRTHNGYLYGYLWIEADEKTYKINGEADKTGSFSAKLSLPDGKTAATLRGSLKNPQNIDCTWSGSGEQRAFKFAQKERLVMGCQEFADFTTSFDALWPRTAACAGCNTWLDQKISDWLSRSKTAVASKRETPAPSARFANRASAWGEVVCWTETIFSGRLMFSDTWSDAQGIAFNFDLRTGKEIGLNDLFNKTFDAKKWLEAFVKKESPKLTPYANDARYREWIAKQGFPLISIHRDGLQLSSVFHPEYGSRHLIVPYAELKPYMKKDNPIGDLVK